jgi:transcriptional antiterminator NusG
MASNDEGCSQTSKEDVGKARWYVIHTYSGYENKVKANIEKIVNNRDMHDLIQELVIPVEETIELTKTGKEKKIVSKIYPTYVFVKMIMNDDTWYVIRNTTGVTSFVGPGSKPVPLTLEEEVSLGITKYDATCGFEVGDTVVITAGSFANQTGVVQKINTDKRMVTVLVDFFGRETPMELEMNQVREMA